MWNKTTKTMFNKLLREHKAKYGLAVHKQMTKRGLVKIYHRNIVGDYHDKEWQNENFILKQEGSMSYFRWTDDKKTTKKTKRTKKTKAKKSKSSNS